MQIKIGGSIVLIKLFKNGLVAEMRKMNLENLENVVKL
jgi:hypothetical protein